MKTTGRTSPRIDTVVAWSGLPLYAARLLRPLVATHGVRVIASRARFPFADLEDHLGAPVHWIDDARPVTWAETGLPVPRLFIHTGWNIPGFNSLAVEAARAGAWRVPMVDNNWKGTSRQWLGLCVYRLAMRRRFDRVIVPGRDGIRFLRRLGTKSPHVHMGMYGADAALFPAGVPGGARSKTVIFVGQLIARKGIAELMDAWRASGAAARGWTLRCFGSGPLKPMLEGVPGVIGGGFAQAAELSVELRNARALILPSREEHWGVVVHEAALSGCALLVSSAAGAAADLVGAENGWVIPPANPAGLRQALENVINQSPKWFDRASAGSVARAVDFGPHRWLAMYEELCADLLGEERRPSVARVAEHSTEAVST